MPPQTRSSTRTAGVSTRASLAQPQTSQETSKLVSKPIQKAGSQLKPKPKPRAKPKVEPGLEPDRKRVRHTSHRRETRKAPKIELLVNLPVEVMIEVARYIHPLDLIMLSRVNKFFRDLFMDKTSATIWRSARENLPGLPSCPEEVSEPQYAAMLFAKRCSACGGYAPREMNPILMIRLCSDCWEDELVEVRMVADSSLVSVFSAPVPGQSQNWMSWCSYKEAKLVKIKLDELNEAGDKEALCQWKEERQKLVKARKRNAGPLSIWLENRERRRVEDQKNLKARNKKEIQLRLMKLGWKNEDFVCNDQNRRKKLNSMLQTTKILTDTVWDNLCPRLADILELNRKERLEREQRGRLSTRESILYDWLTNTWRQLSAYARATPIDGNDSGVDGMPSVSREFDNPVLMCQAFPAICKTYEWPEYLAITRNDVPHSQFLINFEEKKPEFQRAIANWRQRLEEHLITALPGNTMTRLPNFDNSSFAMTVGTIEGIRPINTLPEDIQKLLRADSIFTTSNPADCSSLHFYPHSFNNSSAEIAQFVYHPKACEIARALLSALDMPDAVYLSLKALGNVFRCGRCPQATASQFNWESLVQHYIELIRLWGSDIQRPLVKANESFIYVCTHDINQERPDRALVRISTQENVRTNRRAWTQAQCMLCQSVGLSGRLYSPEVVDHMQDVHLVTAPEAGVHYKER